MRLFSEEVWKSSVMFTSHRHRRLSWLTPNKDNAEYGLSPAQVALPQEGSRSGSERPWLGWAGLAACTVWLLDEVWVDLALVSFLTQLHPHHVTFTLWVSASSSVRWCKSSFGRRQTPSSGLSQTRARNGLSFLIYCRVSIGHPAEMCIFDKCPS